MTRVCSTCGAEKPLDGAHFQWVASRRYFRGFCKSCHNARQRERYKSDPERYKAYSRRDYESHIEDRRECAKARNRQNKERHLAYGRAWREALKVEMFNAYGNQCACCGESEPRFLTLEHSRRDGGVHRRQLGGQTQVYCELKRLGWPREGFELLCWNCQMATSRGVPCPHTLAQANAA